MAKRDRQIMSENIKYYLEKSGKRAIDLCDAVDIPKSTISNWVNAYSYPRMDKINAMAEFFGCDPVDLIRDHKRPINFDESDVVIQIMEGLDYKMNNCIVKISKLSEENKEKVYSFVEFLSSQ